MIQTHAQPPRSSVITPHGGSLVELVVEAEEAKRLLQESVGLPSIILSTRAMCDLELMATGAFSPLKQFLGQADYCRVLEEMRLADGILWPIPITLPVHPSADIRLDHRVVLRSPRYDVLAILTVEEAYGWDCAVEAQAVAGTTDLRHPLVAEMSSWGSVYLSGRLQVLNLPRHYDFVDLRRPPTQLRKIFEELRTGSVLAFQPTEPLTLTDEQFAKDAAERYRSILLLNPLVGLSRQGDFGHFTRVRACRTVVDRYCRTGSTLVSVWPLSARHAGPREALWEAVVNRNYGVSHMVVSDDHGGAGCDSRGNRFYPTGASQDLVCRFEGETGVIMVPYSSEVRTKQSVRQTSPDGTSAEGKSGAPHAVWRPEVEQLVARASPSRDRSGFCVWLTGLSGAGKSSIAEVLVPMLMEYGRQVTILDGDVVRTHLSKGLTFSKEDRDMNIRRIGFVAAEIVRHHGVVICATVSPYRSTRNEVRSMIGEGRFLEVYVNTPIEVCERRDTKGMYAKARKGELRGFTGVNDPYEPPLRPELNLTAIDCTAEDNARRILGFLRLRGFVSDDAGA
jgi:sulfate adenylyltransferase